MNRVYTGIVKEVIDGDTIVCDVDLGFYTWLHGQHFRFYGLNAAEHGTPGGDAATLNLRRILQVGGYVYITSVKNDKFGGRFDAEIAYLNSKFVLTNLNKQLIDEQWAAAWDGTGEKPVPPWPRTYVPLTEEVKA